MRPEGNPMTMKLLEPIQIGPMTIKNRIMFPPLTTGYEERDGSIGEQSRAFYERLAKGGTGYIVLGDVNPVASFSPTPKLFSDAQIPSFAALADAVHAYGAKLGAQIFHPEYDVDAINALARAGHMDEVRSKLHHDMLHFTDEVTEETLLSIIDKMVACAKRCQAAGLDAIEVHGDRLVGCLVSTRMNHRTDKFGGSLENRARFALMLVKALREAVPGMAIDYKFAVVTPERGKGGVDLADAPTFAKWLVEAGVDTLHVAQANHTGNMADTIPPMGVQPYAFFADIAGQIREVVDVPVSTAGRIISPEMAEEILEAGKADFVGVARPLLCDPDWGVKLAAGKPETVRRCISCNKGCTDAIQSRKFVSCVLNPENGYELTRKVERAAEPKRVAVVGGGIAGLTAARVAAERGHSVTLFEKEERLGGQLGIASVPPRKEEMLRAEDDAERAAKAAGAELRLGVTADQDVLLAEGFEAVIVATGATNVSIPVPGADGANVVSSWDVLAGKSEVAGRVAVIGGGLVGCECAEYLAEHGCKVSVVEMLDKIAAQESTTVLPTLMESYERLGVEQHPSTKLVSIDATGIDCVGADGEALRIACDWVVMAVGARPVAFPADKLEAAGVSVTRVGDAGERASDIQNATNTAYDAACAI